MPSSVTLLNDWRCPLMTVPLRRFWLTPACSDKSCMGSRSRIGNCSICLPSTVPVNSAPAVRTRSASASIVMVSVAAPISKVTGGTEYWVEASSLIPLTTEVLNPALETSILKIPTLRYVNWKDPRELVVSVCVLAVPSLVRVTAAPAIDKPCESLTVPSIVPVGTCAKALSHETPSASSTSKDTLQFRWRSIQASRSIAQTIEKNVRGAVPTQPSLHGYNRQ